MEVIQVPIWEPHSLYQKLMGHSSKQKIYSGFMSSPNGKSVLQKLAYKIRANFFVPDARIFWIRPCTRFLKDWLKTNKVDALITTGTPHSVHLIGKRLKRAFDIPWITDFRDPWTEINYYDKVRPIRFIHNYNLKLEKSVLQESDLVLTVSPSWTELLQNKTKTRVELLFNGYDQQDFQSNASLDYNSFTIAHFGFMSMERNCPALWQVLSELANRDDAFRSKLSIQLYGPVDNQVIKSLESFGLKDNLTISEYIKHDKAVQLMSEKSVLLLSVGLSKSSRGWIPAKLFEYMAARRPILAVGAGAVDCNSILLEHGYPEVIDYQDAPSFYSQISALYQRFNSRQLENMEGNIETFERKNLAKQMCDKLDRLIS